MKKTIFAMALAIALVCSAGCTAGNNETGDTTDVQTTVADTTADDTASGETTEAEKKKLFEIREEGGQFSYKLYNLDGTVAEEISGCEAEPVISPLDSDVLRVDVEAYTYYYHLKNRVFSEEFAEVFCEHGTLVLYGDEDKVVVCDMFDPEGLYKEFSDFSGKLREEEPFTEVSFIEDGGAAMIGYVTEDGEEYCDCFSFSNGSRFVLISDWVSELVVITGNEKEEIANFLCGYMGSHEPNTGLPYEYQVRGIFRMNGREYYYCKSFINVQLSDGTVSKTPAGEFLLSVDKTEHFDCRESDGALKVFTENDLN